MRHVILTFVLGKVERLDWNLVVKDVGVQTLRNNNNNNNNNKETTK